MTGYITKYALTDGIIETEIEVPKDFPNMCHAPRLGAHAMFHRNDWHRDRESAVKQANAMRIRKIASIRKTLADLETKVFQ